jgi:hypothetical protein
MAAVARGAARRCRGSAASSVLEHTSTLTRTLRTAMAHMSVEDRGYAYLVAPPELVLSEPPQMSRRRSGWRDAGPRLATTKVHGLQIQPLRLLFSRVRSMPISTPAGMPSEEAP